jgi:hypothetical protein
MMLVWFQFGVLSTIGAEIAAVMGAVNNAQADLESARAGFSQTFAQLGAQLDQFLAGLQLPF